VQADEHEVRTVPTGPAGVAQDLAPVDEVHRPRAVCRHHRTVQTVRVRQVCDPPTAHVVRAHPSCLAPSARGPGVAQPGPVERKQRLTGGGLAAIQRVVRRDRAAVLADMGYASASPCGALKTG
jgi:hypothetical protein